MPGGTSAAKTPRVGRCAGSDRPDGLPLRGHVELPPGFDAVASVLTGLATAPHAHTVVLRVRGTVEELTARIPPALATFQAVHLPGAEVEEDWVRVTIRAERLDWIPALVAGLGRPFHIEQPQALRAALLDLAQMLAAGAGAVADAQPGSASPTRQ